MQKNDDLRRAVVGAALAGGLFLCAHACGDDVSTGARCAAASECYPAVDPGDLHGEATCLDVSGGYCTHSCTTDADCCAAEGECPNEKRHVCSPFESAGQMLCFVSCEADDLGDTDESTFCATFAGEDFTCRSTGGGSKNRKVCLR